MEEKTVPVREGEALDGEKLIRFLREHIAGVADAPVEVRQYPTGASNLTYLIRIGEWEAVLRRPPLGPLPPKAHDMEREATILQKIHPVFPLAPKPYAICRDTSVLGAVFYVMERRQGVVIDGTFPPGVHPTPDLCRRISEAAVDTLVKLHDIDWREAGLASIGRPAGFLERQVNGWIARYDKAKTDDDPEAEPLIRWLSDNVPESSELTVIHNDYKLNNMLWNPKDVAEPVAVLDWEMTTIGDPLFDLAAALSYWARPEDPEELIHVLPNVTTYSGFFSRVLLWGTGTSPAPSCRCFGGGGKTVDWRVNRSRSPAGEPRRPPGIVPRFTPSSTVIWKRSGDGPSHRLQQWVSLGHDVNRPSLTIFRIDEKIE
ncbi:phosphotransferase family protein [Alicyclobacillus pomorum]